MEVLTSPQMSAADSYTIQRIGIPSFTLMEHAARAVADAVKDIAPAPCKVLILTGSGNNGGDGLAAGRLLMNCGYSVDFLMNAPAERLKGDALANYTILKHYPARFLTVPFGGDFSPYGVIVDALYGTGLSRPLEGDDATLVGMVNDSGVPVVAVDIPSGLSGSRHSVDGICICADVTVTFCRPKIPHVLYPAREWCGDVIVADIAIPNVAVQTTCPDTMLVTWDNLPMLPERMPNSHKGCYGHVAVVGGSPGKTGAAVIASLSALRSGAGLTTCILPGSLAYAADSVPEVMSFAAGNAETFHKDDADAVATFCENVTVCAIGPGLGKEHGTGQFLTRLLTTTELPVVLDADGINLLTPASLASLRGRAVLTPHIGEFARLIGMDTQELLQDRLTPARTFATEHGVTLVLKSADTVIATPEGACHIVHAGNAALAKGGSGDALTGLIASFIAQRMQIEDACILACHTLGRTAEILVKTSDSATLLITDIIANYGKSFHEIRENIILT